MKKYDYYTVDWKGSTIIKNLDVMGAKGYRVVAVIGTQVIMEREREEQMQ